MMKRTRKSQIAISTEKKIRRGVSFHLWCVDVQLTRMVYFTQGPKRR
jgi:hypothetical protein